MNQPTGLMYYVRIKRKNLTIFLHCDLNDTVQLMKERVEKLIGHPAAQMRLLLGKQPLENHTSLLDCGIEKEDAEMLLAFSTGKQDATGEEIWEDVVMDGADPGPETKQSVDEKKAN